MGAVARPHHANDCGIDAEQLDDLGLLRLVKRHDAVKAPHGIEDAVVLKRMVA